jgi:hypothetical protein
MSNMTKIGFDRTIQAEWLDAAAARLAAGDSAEAARKYLWDFLEDVEPGTTNSSARGKTLTVLTRIWLMVPDDVQILRESALKDLGSADAENRLAIHWAMVIATHPFFLDVATHVGKLLALHGQANRTQIKRRLMESWGDRSTLERTIQHVLKSMSQWGVLHSGSEKGSLVAARDPIAVSEEIGELLIQGVLLSQGRGMSLARLASHPGLFPFKLQVNAARLRKRSGIRLQRQGDQSDFVELT